MLISIVTPLYNRANFLTTIFESLVKQNDTNIEWIIVDDGSKDNPIQTVNLLIKKASFNIIVHSQVNKGKHFALNKALDIAKGELFFILDSDDTLAKDALKNCRFYYDKIKNDNEIAGIAGRRNFKDGEIVGNQTFSELISNSLDIRYKHKVTGDLVEIYKTKIIKAEKFPEIENEKFCPEALVWNRIAQNYNLLFFNIGIYTTQYLEGGLTDKIVKIRMTSPIASMLTYSELASYQIPVLQKIKAYINFWRFAFNSKKSFPEKLKFLKVKASLLLMPIGYVMYLRDKRKNV